MPERRCAEEQQRREDDDVTQRRRPSAVPFGTRNERDDVRQRGDTAEPKCGRRRFPVRDREDAEEIEGCLEEKAGHAVEEKSEESDRICARRERQQLPPSVNVQQIAADRE